MNARRVRAVADDYDRMFLRERPLTAFLNGVPGTAPDRFDATGFAAVARWDRREDARLARLRAEAERRLGAGFDVREFPDRVLGEGRVPLGFLREEIEKWIEGKEGHAREAGTSN